MASIVFAHPLPHGRGSVTEPRASASGHAQIVMTLCLAVAGALAAQPKRIVSTAPSITETLFALGLGDRVVGVSTYCHYPPEAAKRPRIGTYLRPNVEAIVALRPDLVILQSLPNGAGPQLSRMKLNVLEV